MQLRRYSKYFVRQVDQTDCGAACLAMVLKYWGRQEALYILRGLAGTTQSGTTMAGLKRAGENLGLSCKAFRTRSHSLESINLPLILHWESNHYVVLFRIDSKSILIADPAIGIRKIDHDELEKKWTGNLLFFQPLPEFEKGNFIGKRGIQGLLSHLTHFRGSIPILIEILFGTIMLSSFSLISPLLSQVLFDRVLTFGERQLLPYILWAILGFAVLQTLVSTFRSHLSSYLGMALNYKMQMGYLHHLLNLPLRIHQTRLVGDLLQRNEDLNAVRGVLTNLMITVPVAVLTLLFSLSLLLFYNIQLALVASLSLILNILYVLVISPRLRDNSRKVLKKSGELNSFMIGSLEGISALKAFSAERWATMRGRNQISGVMDQSWRGFMISNNSGVVFGLLGSLGSLLTLWYGATQVLETKLSVGQLVATYGLTNNAVGALSTLIGMVQSVQQGIVSSDRLAEILELPTETDTGKNTHLESLKDVLTVEHLKFSHLPDRPILSDVNMTLAKGSYTVLLGSNGSGKTTLCNVLTSLLEPTGGTILWDGVSLTDYTPEAVRNRVAYQRQEVPMFYASMLDNLTLGRQVDEARVRAVMQALQMDSVIRRLPEGLQTTLGGDSPHRLSSGERQMLGIARLLLSDAEVLILDEPTATLDMDREARVVQILEQLKGNRTLLVITHRPALMAPADQVLKLVEGTIRPYKSTSCSEALRLPE
ncbi:peptidase domain-containing ABC transporter [Deinococcus fonticola]|uniref:peptidase domain-containing ABC transporter n=1 Tax=Deinococcus fonticola TaxID=2528713 RepID=UPI0010754A57|nr:peptidase domain-containing ABC transporter [Deinococcus fonticola]